MPAEGARERDMSRGIVAIYKQSLGKGPIDARTEITASMVVTLITGSLTVAEQTLVDAGKHLVVREMRRTYQETLREEIEALARKVFEREGRSFLSDHDVFADLAVEVVVFDPE